jgi:two-component system chemotaxis sensor kinase CheA
MPLVRPNDQMRIRTEGTQPILVFSDLGRSMGLVVDEIVDIVEDRLEIEVGSDTPGILGSAVIKGQATEIIDVGHFLPLARADWFRRRDARGEGSSNEVLLVDDSAFFRNMLTPVLKAAGYEVTTADSAEAAIALMKKGHAFDVVVTDIDMPGMDGFEFAEALAADQRTAKIPVIALSSLTSPAALARSQQAGVRHHVPKFDRQGLIAALKETTVAWDQAA